MSYDSIGSVRYICYNVYHRAILKHINQRLQTTVIFVTGVTLWQIPKMTHVFARRGAGYKRHCGRDGIIFPDGLEFWYLHTHPTMLPPQGPSQFDYRALYQLRRNFYSGFSGGAKQSSSLLWERGLLWKFGLEGVYVPNAPFSNYQQFAHELRWNTR